MTKILWIIFCIIMFIIGHICGRLVAKEIIHKKNRRWKINSIDELKMRIRQHVKNQNPIIVSNGNINDIDRSDCIKAIKTCFKIVHSKTLIYFVTSDTVPAFTADGIMRVCPSYKVINLAYDGDPQKNLFCNVYIPIKLWDKLDRTAEKLKKKERKNEEKSERFN